VIIYEYSPNIVQQVSKPYFKLVISIQYIDEKER
jgi:hypothetical protein